MKIQNNRFIVPCTMAIFLLIISSCSKSPMDTPVKASTINEYSKNIATICKKFNEHDRETFLNALEVMSGVSYKTVSMFSLVGGPDRTREIFTESINQFNDKTPREIIISAEERIAYLKDKLTESGRQVDGKTVQEILVMAAEEKIRIDVDKSAAAPTQEDTRPELNKRPLTIEQQRARSRAEQNLREVIDKSN